MFKVIFGVGVIAFLLQISGTSVAKIAKSVKFDSVENLNMEKMSGQWYILRDDDSGGANPCYLIDFRKHQSNKYSVELCKTIWQFVCFDFANLTLSDRISGERLHNSTQSIQYDFIVPETDYDNYAVVQFYHNRLNFVLILSRNNVLDAAQLDKLTTKYIGTDITWTHSNNNCSKKKCNQLHWSVEKKLHYHHYIV